MANGSRIVALFDADPVDRGYDAAISRMLDQLAGVAAFTVVPMDEARRYVMDEIGPPEWLVVALPDAEVDTRGGSWREVVAAAPAMTAVIMLTQGPVFDVPRVGVETFDMTGWSGASTDARMMSVVTRIMSGPSTLRYEEVERDAVRRGALVDVGDGTTMLNPELLNRIEGLGLSKAAFRILREDNIFYVGDLVQMTEAELLRMPELGRKRLGEIKGALSAIGLRLGLVIPGWPPEDMEAALAGASPQEVVARARQIPSGEMFEARVDRLAIDPAAGGMSDREAGASAVSIQLQDTLRRKLAALAPLTDRLGNQAGWQDLSSACERLAFYLDRPGDEMPGVLGSLYGAALELGSFAEMDEAARGDPSSDVMPLDPSIGRPLRDVLSGLAPWLRRFPTVRELDDEAGRFLVAHSISPSARRALVIAAEVDLIGTIDAARLRALLDAGERGAFLGDKAGRRGLLSVRNLVLAAAAVFGNMMWDAAVSDYATRSMLARRAGTMLARAEDAIIEVASTLPADVSSAVRELVGQAKHAEPHVQRPGADPDVSEVQSP